MATRGELPLHSVVCKGETGNSVTPATDSALVNPADFDLEGAKRRSVKLIEAVLGPGGESLALAIERSETQLEFAQQAERTRQIISQMAGQRKAIEFWVQTGL